MRIIAGAFKGRKLHSPLSDTTRPTSDRTRETIFNILNHRLLKKGDNFTSQKVLDVFAGTGALGLEALSRGAQYTAFIEKDPRAIRVLKANIADLKCAAQTHIICADIKLLKQKGRDSFSFVFVDPPYNKGLIKSCLRKLANDQWLDPDALVVCEMDPEEILPVMIEYEVQDERIFRHCKIMILQFKGDKMLSSHP